MNQTLLRKTFTPLLLLLIGSLVIPKSVFAQQEAPYSQYMFNRMAVNPAYTGIKGGWNVTALYRHQWAGFDGAPRTATLAAHRGFGDESRHGAGGLVMTDQSGLLRRTTIAANYAFRIKVRLSRVKFGYLSMGLQGAAIQNSFNGGDVELQEQNDPSIPESGQSSFTPDIGTGVFFNTDRWYVGGSITHLAEFEMGFPDEDGSEAQLTRHYNFTGGIDIPTSRFDRKVVISPSFFVRSANQAPWQFDANVNVTFLQKFWVGGLYRFQDAVAVLAGVYPTPNLRIGYSYDITTSDLAPYNNGTHEISVSYDFGFDKPTIKSPRFF